MGMPVGHYYTAEDLLTMPVDGHRYEVVHGELLVTPAPRRLHQRIVSRLILLLGPYLNVTRVGEVYPGGDLPFADESLVIPDLLVQDLASARAPSWEMVRPPLLVVEVVSPSSARQDRFAKRRLYQEMGVPLYWLVDAEARTVEVWTPEARVPITERHSLRWHPAGSAEPLVISLAELFREI